MKTKPGHLRNRKDIADAAPIGVIHAEWQARRKRKALDDLGACVYFLLHFGHIKIGHTADLESRLRSLGADMSDVLMVIRGPRADETAYHRKYAHLRVDAPGMGREHYRFCAELINGINDLRALHQLDPLDLAA